jgi:hypothetical protein
VFCKNGGGAGIVLIKNNNISVTVWLRLNFNLKTVIDRNSDKESNVKRRKILFLALVKEMVKLFGKSGGGAGIAPLK